MNSNYEIIGMIDESESVLWTKKYNDIGECEIYIPCNEKYLSMLRKENYVYRYDDDMFCVIKNFKITTDIEDGDYIIATAKDICTIMSGRIVRWNFVYSGNVSGFFEKLLNENFINASQFTRNISNFEIDTSNFNEFDETIDITTENDDILQLIIQTCKTYNYGFRLSYDINRGKLVFRLYKGKNKATQESNEYIEFSPQFSNILSTEYEEEDENYKNVVYVSYKNTNDDVFLFSIFNGDERNEPSGEYRKEIFVDGTNITRDIKYDELLQMYPNMVKESRIILDENENEIIASTYYKDSSKQLVIATSEQQVQEEGEEEKEEKITLSTTAFLRLIQNLGLNTLADHPKTKKFSGEVDTIDTYEYKTDYDLGDIVKVINSYGIEADARITEMLESDDNEDGHVYAPVFEYIE